MISVHSLSGGKTSSYMALHYPADYNLFSLITVDDVKLIPLDKSIVKYASEKLNAEFIATAESDMTIYAMRDLEQLLGKEIIWVKGQSFEKLNKKRSALPNQMWRFCTTEMKMRPIFDWWNTNIKDKIKMGVGFRYDEKERANNFSTSFKTITGKRGTRNKWEDIEWREGWFPLIEDKITHYPVYQWAEKSGIKFPADSNCVGCFWKPVQQLRKNWDNEPLKMQWFADQETNSTWKKEMTYEQIKTIGLQQDFFFGTGSGCQAGFCTD
jgi:hypothetical protein